MRKIILIILFFTQAAHAGLSVSLAGQYDASVRSDNTQTEFYDGSGGKILFEVFGQTHALGLSAASTLQLAQYGSSDPLKIRFETASLFYRYYLVPQAFLHTGYVVGAITYNNATDSAKGFEAGGGFRFQISSNWSVELFTNFSHITGSRKVNNLDVDWKARSLHQNLAITYKLAP